VTWVTGPALAESGSGRSAQPFVWRIDPGANEVVASIRGAGGLSLAADDEAVWGSSFGDVSRIDPDTSRVTATIPFPTLVWDVAVGEGAVWAVGDSLWRINPETATVEATIPIGGGAVVAAEGSVWIASGSAIARVDPETNAVVATIELGSTNLARGIAVGEGLVWVTVG
jgi:sugar lactone lactonase YvrE